MHLIKEFIRLGNTDKAIERLHVLAGERFENEVIHLSSRYEHLLQEKIRGTLDSDDHARELQKINADILDLLTRIEKSTPGGAKQGVKTNAGLYKYRKFTLAVILVAALGALVYMLWNKEEKTYYFNVAASRNVPVEITNVLDSLRTISENVRDISINEHFYWVILVGRDRALWSKDVPPFLDGKLREVYDQNRHTIRQVALGPHPRWVLLFNEKDYWVYPDVRDTLRNYLDDDAWRHGEALKQVIFGPKQDEFLILSDGSFFAYSKIPGELLNCLKSNSGIHSVSIGPNDEWVAVTGPNNAISSAGIDGELRKTLDRLNKKNREIRRVCLLKNGGWIVLTD